MFKKILIANRGEIALRIMNTCKDMGIETVAVYSHADEKALHVIKSDQAVCLGPSEPLLSYLDMNKIINAAKQTGAEAIHPGYGFFSENSDFALRCQKEKIVFIGPSPKVIKAMGDKITSRHIMVKADVPVVPGFEISRLSSDEILKQAQTIGYPVLIKATAGGGGKGIRIVNTPDELESARKAASSEAFNAFGNGNIYIEKFFTNAKHIEFQILADMHGNTIHLLERECSVQRRHQKIIEETPSMAITSDMRRDMGNVAVTAAKAAGYTNAGTVEFLVDDKKKNFYFLEMNTRLQVEHPITEMITGIDIVRHQLEISAGMHLTLDQNNITSKGHSMECRIYAEDPEQNFFPSPGKIHYFKEPTGPGIRNDCGVYQGVEVPMEYDPIISKLVVHAASREESITKMTKALKDYIILGVKTPIEFLLDVLDSQPFKEGKVFTNFVQQYFPEWTSNKGDDEIACLAFLSHELCLGTKNNHLLHGSKGQVETPFKTLGNWTI